jgi:hypothetical protein
MVAIDETMELMASVKSTHPTRSLPVDGLRDLER